MIQFNIIANGDYFTLNTDLEQEDMARYTAEMQYKRIWLDVQVKYQIQL